MKKGIFGAAIAAALLGTLLASFVDSVNLAVASTAPPFKIGKQSSAGGDTIGTAADTSSYIMLPTYIDTWMIFAQAESTSIYTTQISADGTKWYTVDVDTVTKGTAEGTVTSTGAPLFQGGIYGGMRMRVILDNTTSASSTGAAYLVQTLAQ